MRIALAALSSGEYDRGRKGIVVADRPAGLDKADRQEENAAVAVAGRQRGTHMGFARMLATI
ncbi:MAG TPA: hypothetical protein VIH21_12270, partial [Dehalococcoidia bacterium]